MRVCVLGGIMVVGDDGCRRPINGPRPRLILALLASRGGQPVGDDAVIEAIWGASPPPSARTAVQTYVSALRDELEPDRPRRSPGSFICLEPSGYSLDLDRVSVDIVEFDELIDRARTRHPDDSLEAAALLDQALAMWADPPLGCYSEAPWALGVVTRLREAHGSALESRFGLALDAGAEGLLADRMEAAVAAYPYRERLAGQRMLALYRSGRQQAALQQFASTRDRLRDDLGLDPGRELCLLEQAILEHDPALVNRSAHVSGDSMGPGADSIPLPRSRLLMGRDRDIDAVIELMEFDRLVTIVGPGGVGKSALATAVAERLDTGSGCRVVHVDFADLGGRHPTRALASALRVVEHPLVPLSASVVDGLGNESVVVVAQTCEAALDEVSSTIGAILGARSARVLATSQVPLRRSDERVYRLAPLSPEAAVRMLGPAHGSERAVLERIAERVDRLPLGLELARARLDALGPDELDRGLRRGDSLLVGGDDRPDRQRSVRSAVEWSLDLLDRPSRTAIETLSTLSSPFTVGVAGALGVDVGVVCELVDRSILQRLEATPAQFRLPDSVRAAVLERAEPADVEDARCRVAELCFTAAMARVFRLDTPVDLVELDGEIVGALAWFAGRHDERQLALAGFLAMYFIERGRISEGRELINAAIDAHPDANDTVRLLTTAQLGFLTWYQGDARATAEVLTEIMGLLDQAPNEKFRCVARGCLAFSEQRFVDAARELGAGVEIQPGSSKQNMLVLHLAGNACWYAGELDRAHHHYRTQYELAHTGGDAFHLAQALRFDAMLTAHDGDIEKAWRWAQRSLTMAHEMNDSISLAQSSAAMAIVASVADATDDAFRHASDALVVGAPRGDVFALRVGLSILIWGCRRRGDDDVAAQLAGWYLDLLERSGQTHFPATVHLRAVIPALRRALGPTTFAALSAEGAARPVLDLVRSSNSA